MAAETFQQTIIRCSQWVTQLDKFWLERRLNTVNRAELGSCANKPHNYNSNAIKFRLVNPTQEANPSSLCGRGSLGIKVFGSLLACCNFEPVPLKTHHVEKRCTLKLSRVQTFSRWNSSTRTTSRGGALSALSLISAKVTELISSGFESDNFLRLFTHCLSFQKWFYC
ncbi:hypothetical protein TNCV_4650471 [Trichonephila clavipes]|nr:hypothetical protein TNCV_4650471 [Trichonephila clavipes]